MTDQQPRDTPTATATDTDTDTDSPPPAAAAAPAAPSSPAPQAELIPAEDPEVRCTLPNLPLLHKTCRVMIVEN
jgi:hypothetical protein